MARIKQRGVGGVHGCRDCRSGDPANHPVGPPFLDTPLARLLGQPMLLHLRALLAHVPAKKARSGPTSRRASADDSVTNSRIANDFAAEPVSRAAV